MEKKIKVKKGVIKIFKQKWCKQALLYKKKIVKDRQVIGQTQRNDCTRNFFYFLDLLL